MQIFEELRTRGVSGLEEGVKVIFPTVVVHLVRNSLRYVPSKNYKAFTTFLKDCMVRLL